MSSIPAGYELFPVDGGFNDAMSPLYYNVQPEGTIFGLQVDKQHCNPMGVCHGAVYMTLMDIALSSAICHKIGKYMGLPTISLNSDFLASAQLGDWIWADVEALQVTRNFGFSHGVIRNAEGTALMRANGNFKLPMDVEKAQGVTVEELMAMKGS